jgi:hypothetical protein
MSRPANPLRALPKLLIEDRFLGISVLAWLIGCGLLLPRSGLTPPVAGAVLLAGLAAIIISRARKAARRPAAGRATTEPASRKDADG